MSLLKTNSSIAIQALCRICATLLLAGGVGPMPAQSSSVSTEAAPVEVLTLDHALELARANNRMVRNAVLALTGDDHGIAQARSYRYSQVHVYGLAGELLSPLDFRIAEGALGSYPGTGPIPSTDRTVRAPREFTMDGAGQIALPLFQQYKLGLRARFKTT